MQVWAPGYYKKFRCTASHCRHSCCIGWEIDIDEATAHRYTTFEGKLGDTLREAMVTGTDGTVSFGLDERERCPLLREDGLCRIICEKGESALCQICQDHPRFRHEFSDHTEVGLGLCCETAVSVILGEAEPFSLEPVEEIPEKAFPLSSEEKEFLSVRSDIFALVTDHSLPLYQRMNSLSFRYGNGHFLSHKDSVSQWISTYRDLERLDPDWDRILTAGIRRKEPLSVPRGDDLSLPLQQLLSTLLYRHLPPSLWDGRLQERVEFCLHATAFLATLASWKQSETFCDLVRAYSAEIEYSEENTETLIALFA